MALILCLIAIFQPERVCSGKAGEARLSAANQRAGDLCQEYPEGAFGHFLADPAKDPLKGLYFQLMRGVRQRDSDSLNHLIHPRLGTGPLELQKIMATISRSLGSPWELSLLRAFRLPDSEAFLSEGIWCEGEGVRLFPHYGYKSQWFLWFQLSGSRELGRLFVSLVPEPGASWKIGYLNFQKWTHGGKNPRTWIEEADQELKQGNEIAAGARYRLALKLIAGNPHLSLGAYPQLKAWIHKVSPDERWQGLIRSALPGDRLVRIASLFASDGLGFLLRFHLDEEIPGKEVRAHCQERLARLQKKSWFRGFRGIRCSYHLPGEPEGAEGRLGSLYLEP